YEQQKQFSFGHGGKSAAPRFVGGPPANRDAGHAVPPFSSGEQTNKVLQPVATASRQAWPGKFRSVREWPVHPPASSKHGPTNALTQDQRPARQSKAV